MTWEKDWNTDFGNNPEDTESRKYGAQQIRWLKDAIVERMQVDHEFGEEIVTTGTDDQNDTGYHKKVTLLKTTNAEPASGYTALAAEGNLLTYFPEGDSEHTLVDLDSTQTFTNKTLTAPSITSPAITTPTITSPVITGAAAAGLVAAGVARIDDDGGNDNVLGAVSAIARIATGTYRITYASTTAANVIVVATSQGENFNCTIDAPGSTTTTIYTYNPALGDAVLTDVGIHVVMFDLTVT